LPLKITVNCLEGEILNASAATALCNKVSALLENQGAKVETNTVRTLGKKLTVQDNNGSNADKNSDLTVILSAQTLVINRNTWMWAISIPTFTLFPVAAEYVMQQQVEILDSTGFMITQDAFQARFIRYFGIGYWTTNKLLNLIARDPEDEISDQKIRDSFSRDFYGNLSQTLFNAKMRLEVLRMARAGTKESSR
jgi:hypothetical protein